MAGNQLSRVLRHIRRAAATPADDLSDGSLLQRFSRSNDESAFAILLERHGPMVWGVCRRFLSNGHDAEDAFQATFLLLVRKAGGLRDQELVGNWLYGVACRVARRARTIAFRRPAQTEVRDMASAEPEPEGMGPEVRHLIDEELQRLPRKYRVPVVLCYLQGQTNEAAAQKLRCPAGTIKTRLSRARDLLRDRLARRGLALSLPALSAALAPASARAVPAALTEATLRAAMLWAAGQTAGTVSAPIASLVKGTAAEIVRAKLQTAAAVLLALVLVGAGAGLWAYFASPGPGPVAAEPVVSEPEPVAVQLDDGGLAAGIHQRVRAWQPTPAERRFDEIGWVRDLRTALQLAGQTGRPIFLVSTTGRIETGRASASATNLRAGAFSNDRVIALLNGCFVPVYVSSGDYAADGPAAPEEKAALRRIRQSAAEAGMGDGGNYTWVLSADGTPLAALEACHALADRLIGLLEELAQDAKPAEGKPLIAPARQSRPPAHEADAVVLHLTCRYLERQGEEYVLPKVQLGRSINYFSRGCPAENWLVWPRAQWTNLLPGAVKMGDSWELDAATIAPLFRVTYPPTEDNDVQRNRIDQASLRATVVALSSGLARARLDGSLRMKHRFDPEKDDNKFVEAQLTGYVDFDVNRPAIRALELVSTRATYGKSDFGVALRLQR
jgi:RNA polymerase sigma factor (sigma-70 family)